MPEASRSFLSSLSSRRFFSVSGFTAYYCGQQVISGARKDDDAHRAPARRLSQTTTSSKVSARHSHRVSPFTQPESYDLTRISTRLVVPATDGRLDRLLPIIPRPFV